MEWLLPVFLGGIALAYVSAPLWAGISQSTRTSRVEGWHSQEQLELDRELGKIDDAEYEELKPRAPAPLPLAPNRATLPSLEALIYRARHHKRLETTLEAEVLIARARQKNKS